MPNFKVMSTLGAGSYDVEFYDTIANVYAAVDAIPNARVISDIWIKREFGCDEHYGLAALETCKTLSQVDQLCDWLNAQCAGKETVLVAIGGGIIQDVATMAAAIYKRGIKLVLVPTTLMAQADSGIGAKCGINVRAMKNQVGCFYAPSRVMICHQFLDTLPNDHMASGYGEILKLLLIGGSLPMVRSWVEEGGLRNRGLPEIINRALKYKRGIIEADERECGKLRVLLNYGHTFGHALEATQRIPHGLAVAWGIDVVNFINTRHAGLLSEGIYFAVKDFIRRHLPFKMDIALATPGSLILAVGHDKKAKADGTIDLVVMDRPGEMHLSNIAMGELARLVASYLRTENVYGVAG